VCEFDLYGGRFDCDTNSPSEFSTTTLSSSGSGSIVGIVTGYGVVGPGIEFRWGRVFPHLFRPVLGPTQPSIQWVPCLSRGKERPGRDA
jgi:hypothetical protein